MTDVEQPGGRREELLAAALAGDLSSEEAIEFDRLRAADPTLDRELASFGVVLDRLGGLVRWDEAEPSAQLRSRVLGLAAAEEAAPPSRRGRLALAVGAAAACLVLGVVAGSAFQAAGERPSPGRPAPSARSRRSRSTSVRPGSGSTVRWSRTPGAPRRSSAAPASSSVRATTWSW